MRGPGELERPAGHGADLGVHVIVHRRWARWAIVSALLLVVIVYGVLPLLGDVPAVVETARSMSPWWFLPGLVLEAASIVAFGCYTRSLLTPGARPGLWRLTRIDLTTWGAQHVLPGGPAGVAALRFRLLRAEGVPEPDAALLSSVQGVASALVLHGMLWVALAVAVVVPGEPHPAALGALAGTLALVDLVVVLAVAARRGGWAARRLRWLAERLPGVDADRVDRDLRGMVRQLHRIVRDPRQVAESVGWAASNWLLDALALMVFVVLLAGPVDPLGVFVAFGLASALAVLPITPGGVGIVEGVLVPALVVVGVPAPEALVAVLGWRIVGYWLPIPAAALAWVSLRVGRHR
ncbi:flippase-like domain-containing protein [Pseudonocardia sp. KRD-184]|uniref:Flippase-like domain-containing protein n=2 Tax=Pseudonocardia oceani TaxID=2792013 RepID=A0ABS6UHJ8_9PSEU|nr:YbhN family protein [Pseudonocardia oceani]MBW0096031.1 flippase-like domain-containing protein [Pseudonocardia oceani]MBW0111838.1 flippase-like domain-containing protein [Pseudonocardia oceani]MBW0122944.1 flippase-like domain-containing protein [Pseudonocardia oceani]MBW0131693.1 flippase-like domain-containing protein [Pseudonocardia oceani]